MQCPRLGLATHVGKDQPHIRPSMTPKLKTSCDDALLEVPGSIADGGQKGYHFGSQKLAQHDPAEA